ncbi:MAG: type II toxin-antitoxin system HicB family antitoxin [Hyphomicrobiaceae bacterium]
MPGYFAVIHKDPDSDYGVSFPDLPGCISAGTTLDDASTMAAEALSLHIEGLIADGETLPTPSPLDVIAGSKEAGDAVAILLIEAQPALQATA